MSEMEQILSQIAAAVEQQRVNMEQQQQQQLRAHQHAQAMEERMMAIQTEAAARFGGLSRPRSKERELAT